MKTANEERGYTVPSINMSSSGYKEEEEEEEEEEEGGGRGAEIVKMRTRRSKRK